MNDVNKIYNNDIGITFQWKHVNSELTQIIFRDTGFHLSTDELELFLEKVEATKKQKHCNLCKLGGNCRSILLQTPFKKVTLAISQIELNQIEDLLRGTLFQLKLKEYLTVCKN